MEKILEINEIDEKNFSGYSIITTKQIIKLLMATGQHCCENYGYFLSQDDFSAFINSELFSIKLTDDCLNEALLLKNVINIHERSFEGNLMFVNLETSAGTLQFTAYNEHNGYYGHAAKVISSQLNHAEYL